MPIIRYRTGDRGKIRLSDCACGMQHPILYSVEGRRTDYYDGPEVGRPINWEVVSPISHDLGDIIDKWRAEVYIKEREMRLHVVPKESVITINQINRMTQYKEYIRKEFSLTCFVVVHKEKDAEEWKRHLLKVIKDR